MARPAFFGMVTTSASRGYTPTALGTFFAVTVLDATDRFFLIDNDGAQAAPPSGAELIRNQTPLTFAENVNQILERALEAGADLYFLNNDVVFTRGWREAQGALDGAVTSPLSNREVQYAETVINPRTQHVARMFITGVPMTLEEYAGKEAAVAAIAEAHHAECSGFWRVFALPFFCVKIPLPVLQAVGRFDTAFGIGGGEDFDYCLRAYLAGFEVQFALQAYMLHFYGKSTWSGAEDQEQRVQRERRFMTYFRSKWGDALHDLLLQEDASALSERGLAEKENSREQLQSSVLKLMEGRRVQIRL